MLIRAPDGPSVCVGLSDNTRFISSSHFFVMFVDSEKITSTVLASRGRLAPSPKIKFGIGLPPGPLGCTFTLIINGNADLALLYRPSPPMSMYSGGRDAPLS